MSPARLRKRRRPPPEPGTSQAAADVRATLWKHRRDHGWAPGRVWDPNRGTYVPADEQTYWPAP